MGSESAGWSGCHLLSWLERALLLTEVHSFEQDPWSGCVCVVDYHDESDLLYELSLHKNDRLTSRSYSEGKRQYHCLAS